MAMTPLGRRTRLLTGCAMASAMAGHAHAQSYPDRALQGSSTTVSGNVSISRSSTIDHITIASPTAIINWNPETGPTALPPGPINFLPTGRTASFEAGYGTSSFTVLNRVLPSDTTRPIVFNGSITSPSGGAVWFYSPGGIIAGATATFNVGSLVLTANDIDTSSGFGGSSTNRFRGTAGSQSKIEIQAGAKINALNSGSYVALVAPVVQMAGDVKTAGSAAYIAGEKVDVRINSGLFDINFQTGGGTSVAGEVLSHTGSTSSPSGNYNGKGIFLAAMPKNQAISMLLSGTAGYQAAATANVENGIVVLAAGSNIQAGAAQVNYAAPKLASILVGAGNITSSFNAVATDTITIKPTAASSTNFSGSVSLQGPNLLVNADAAAIGIGTYLSLDASGVTGGMARLFATNGGTVDAGGAISLYAAGRSLAMPLVGDDTAGGTVAVNIDNGRISATDDLTLSVTANGGYGINRGGTGRAGLATIDVRNTGSTDGLRAYNLTVFAQATGGESGYGAGGSAVGGTIRIDADAATLQTNDILLSAIVAGAYGYGVNDSGSSTAGTIQASLKNLTLAVSSLTFDATASATNANGQNSGGGNGGSATGGNISLLLDNATVSSGNGFSANTSTTTGYSSGGNGGSATAGIISLNLNNASTFNADVSLYARAEGGRSNFDYDADDDGVADAFGRGGTAIGGSITLGVSESNLFAPGYVDLSSNAVGGQGAIGGNATGGSILINFPSGTIDPSQASYFSARADATAGSTGLRGGNPRVDTARSGDATGGQITLSMGGEAPALLQFSDVRLSAIGTTDGEKTGDVGAQGDIRGGTILATLTNATINALGGLVIDASARGGQGASNFGGDASTGGNAFGGSATLNADNSTISGSSIDVLADARGGNGHDYQQGEGNASVATLGGSATGGMARINAISGSLGGPINVDAAANGGTGGSGNGTAGAAAGAAQGGTAYALFDQVQLSGSISVSGEATGGAGGSNNECFVCGEAPPFGAGDGGNAISGNATLNLSAYNSSVGELTVSSAASGGAGGIVDPTNWNPFVTYLSGGKGGSATGAVANVTLAGIESSFNGLTIRSVANGGEGGSGPTGGAGGNALSGALNLQIANSAPSLTTLTVDASASGGAGGASGFVTGAAGGNATAGAVGVAVNGPDGALILPSDGAAFDASAHGGAGASSQADGGNGGAGGNATAGSLSFTIDQGLLDGINSSSVWLNLLATGGSGASGTTGGQAGGTGGNGGIGGNATGGLLSFTASNAGAITMPQFTLDVRALGGDGGYGGAGGNGQTGSNGVGGLDYGQDGDTGGTGGAGGLGGNGGRGGNALGGSFSAIGLSGASISFGNLDIDLSALAGRSGDGGQGGYGGSGGSGGYGGLGFDDGDGNVIDPGNGGMGGDGGLGGDGGNGGDGANATGGTFTLDANGGTITADGLSARATAQARFGGRSGYAGPGGEGGSGGEGGYGAQENQGNPGDPGTYGIYGNDGVYGADGQAQGGLISVTVQADEAGGGTLSTGSAFLETTSGIFDGEGTSQDGPQGQIHILANGAASTLNFNGLQAYAGDSLFRTGYDGLIDIGGTDAAINFNNSTLISSGSIQIHLSGAASILAGENFEASQLVDGGDITISHEGLPGGVDTIYADQITLKSGGYIDTSSSRLGAYDAVDLQAVGDATIGSAHVSGSTYADSNGPHGAEIRVTAGGNPFFRESPAHAGNLTVTGVLDARGGVSLNASNDIFVNAGAAIGADNRVSLIADGDVTIAGGASINAAREPLAENGYGGFDPFDQNGMLTIQAGAATREFGLAAGDISSVVIGGLLNANNGAISIDGAAIDATGSTASAQYIRADIFGASEGGSSNDNGRLRTGCTEGLICLGGLNSSGTIAIGARGAPTTASITGPTLVSSLDVNAIGDIHFGDGTNAFTVRGTDYFHATSSTGDIVLDGPVTLQGDNDFALSAGRGLVGPQGSVIALNDLVLTAPSGLSLTDLIIGDQFLPTGTIDNFSVTGMLKLGSGDLILSTMNGLTLGDIVVGNGAAVSLTSSSGPITVNSIGGAGNGTPTSIVLDSGGALTLTTGANTSGNFSANAVGAANFGTSSAGGSIDITAGSIGFSSLTATGNVNLASSGLISGGALASGGATSVNGGSGIALNTLSAPGAVTLTSMFGPVTVTNIGQSPLAKPTSITVNAGGAVVLTHAETSGNLLVDGASFQTGLNSIITGGDIDINVAGLADMGNSSAGGHADITAGSIDFVSLTTGAYTTLTSTGSITGSTLNSGAITTLQGDSGVSIATLMSTGAVSLNAVNGAAAVTTQLDAPSITAGARSIALTSGTGITAPMLTATAGGITVTAASFSGTNATASGAVGITAPGGVSLATLNAGAASALNAANGAVLVSSDITVSALDAVGRSVTLRATGSLTGLTGQATAGAFDAQAGGAISGGVVSASTNAILVAPLGITLTGLTTGGTASLSASTGNINVVGAASNGLTATARDIYLRGPGTLTATNLVSSVGGIDVQTAGNLTVNSANAKSALTLGSTGGSLGFTTLVAGDNTALTAATTITGGTLNSTSATVGGFSGVTLTGVSVTGTAALLATNGLIDATNVSAGNVTATARGITLTSPTLLSASQLTATAGAIDVRGAQLALGTASATGMLDARAIQSGITFTTAQAGGNATLIAASTVNGTTLTSGGDSSVTGPGGITIATTTSTGTTNLSAAGGAIDIGTNAAASALSATARSVRLRAAGALNVGNVQATAGNVDIQSAGLLGIGTGTASQQLTATSTGGALAFTTLSSGTTLTLSAAGLTSGASASAGGDAAIGGTAGVDIGDVTTPGTATLTANSGAVRVTNNLSAASTTASGRSVFLRSTGTITAPLLRATAGDVDVRADTLAATTVQATGLVTLTTTNGALNFTTLSAGGDATLNAGNTLTGNSLTAANATLTAPGAINVATLTTGAANITSLNGGVTVGTDLHATSGTIAGRSVTLRSLGDLTLTAAQASAGATDISASGNLNVGTATASGALTLASTGRSLGFTNASTGSDATLSAAMTITGGTLTATGAATLTAPNGITLTGLNAGSSQLNAASGLVQVSGVVGSNIGVNANAIRLSGAGPFGASTLTANNGLLDLNFGGNVTLGNATATTTLAVTSGGTLAFTSLASGGDATLTGTAVNGGTLNTGGNAAVIGTNGVTLTGFTATGSAALNASSGSINVSGLSASDVFASGLNVALSAPDALMASSLTATDGDLTLSGTRVALGTASATGAINGNASATDISFASLSSGGATTLTAATVIAGGTLAAGGDATLTASNGITLTGLNAGGTSQLTTATNGQVTVSGLVGSNVSVTAGAITLAGAGAFGASNLIAGSGLLSLNFGGDITLGSASAATNLDLTSSGALGFISLTSGGAATLTGMTVTGGTLNSGGLTSVDGLNGVTLTGLTVGGAGSLTAANGAIDATGLTSGNYAAAGRSVRLRGIGGLTLSTINATAGAIGVTSAGTLTLAAGTAAGGVMLASDNGDLIVSSLTGGATNLTAANGIIDANFLTLASLDATARGVRLRGNGALTANTLTATAGNLDASFGSITVTTASGSVRSILNADTGNVTVVNLSGGRAALAALNGAVAVANDSASDTIATARSIALTAPRSLNASSLTATAGDLTLRGANLALGSGSTAGLLDARSSTGALGFTTLASGGNATLVSATIATGTTLTAGGAISITAPGGIDIANLRAVGAAVLQSSGAIRITNDLATSSLTASGASLFLRSLGSLNAATLTATGGAIDIGTAGALTFGSLNSGGAATITAGTTVTGTTLTSGGTTNVTAPAGITLGTLNSTGVVTLTAANGPVQVNTEVAGNNLIVDAGSIFLRTPGALSLAQVRSSTGDVDILATGDLSITSATAAGTLTLGSSGGNLTIGSVGGQLSPATASLSALGSVTLGNAAARTAINVTAGTVANLNGVMTAPTIAIRSPDIAISTAARIGTVTGTTQLTFTSTAGTATIGGSSTGTGYRLSEAELQRAFANTITVLDAPAGQRDQAIDPNATPTMTLDTLTLGAAGQSQQAAGILGNAGTLRFQTSGTMRVAGAVKLTGANSGNRLELTGGPAIQLRPGGSASLVNGSDLAGTLVLTAADIIAGDATTLTGLSTAADAKAQSDLLGANTNPTDDTGYFAANGIIANIGHGLFVQNSGATQATGAQTFDQRRGLTFGAGGLTITPTAQAPVTVIVNGRQVSSSASGGFITGTALVPIVKVTGNSVAAGSTINGCAIANPGACAFVAPIDRFDPESVIDPGVIARDVIEEGELSDELEAASNAINRPNVLVELPGFSALVGQPLIEDPVTGSGNDDLLADKDGKQCDPSVETCTGD